MSKLLTNAKWQWATKLTRLKYARKLAGLGQGVIVDPGCCVKSRHNVSIDDYSRIYCNAKVVAAGGDEVYVRIVKNTEIAYYAWLDAAGGHIEVGDNVYIGPYTYVGGHGGCKIGDDCQIAGFCYIISANHNFDDRTKPIRTQGYVMKGVTIGPDCWLGNGVTVLDGVTVGRGCVLAARSVVTKDVPDFAVVAGVPAQIVRYRGNRLADNVDDTEVYSESKL